jgi:uncharacterized protein YybS (DUF2232 family)
LQSVLVILLTAVFLLFILAVSSLASTWGLLRGMRPGQAVLAGALGAALFWAVIFIFIQGGDTTNVSQLVQKAIEQVEQTQVPKPFNASPESTRLYQEFVKNYMILSFPGWIASMCLVLGLLSYYLSSVMLSRVTSRVTGPVAFSQWVIPEHLVFGLLAGGILKLTEQWLKLGSWADIVSNNLLVFFLALYSLGGLSIVSFFLHKWRLPAILRLLSYVVLLQMFETVCALGVLDVWFDFRKLKSPPPEPAT